MVIFSLLGSGQAAVSDGLSAVASLFDVCVLKCTAVCALGSCSDGAGFAKAKGNPIFFFPDRRGQG